MSGISRFAAGLNRSRFSRCWVKVWGNVMASPSLDRTLYLWLHRLGWMARGERERLAEWIRPGMCVVDVGANVGLYTGLFSRLVGPTGRVISVEPVDANFESLSRSVRRNGWANVEAHHCALAAESGAARMKCDPLNSGNNAIERIVDDTAAGVTLKTVDEIVAGRRVDFIKVDVQGWEASVLRGGRRTLRENRPLKLFLEIWPAGLRAAGSSAREIFEFVREAGLEIESPAGWEGLDAPTDAGYYDIVAGGPAGSSLDAARTASIG
jgi:FkbM family methyltransferase